MNFIPKDKVQWRAVDIIQEGEGGPHKYRFTLPLPLADWDVWRYWEKERFASMEQHLKKGDILFDVGTESGWCNLIYAQFVGPQNIVLIEPTQEFWPNIKATWEKNYDVPPKAVYDGLFSDKTTAKLKLATEWPQASSGDMIDRNKYQYIHANDENVPEMKLDDYVRQSGIIPDALTIDVEGAELLVLKGAQQTLERHPKVWISIHPDLGERDYDVTSEQVHTFMKKLGYKGEHLVTDHETHYYYE